MRLSRFATNIAQGSFTAGLIHARDRLLLLCPATAGGGRDGVLAAYLEKEKTDLQNYAKGANFLAAAEIGKWK